MCLAVPARVVSIEGATALVDVSGNRREADVSLLDAIEVGDYVLVHAGFAIGTYDEADARERLELFEELGRAGRACREERKEGDG